MGAQAERLLRSGQDTHVSRTHPRACEQLPNGGVTEIFPKRRVSACKARGRGNTVPQEGPGVVVCFCVGAGEEKKTHHTSTRTA
jgi:hypothetical protein